MACKANVGEPNTYASGNCTWWCKQQRPWIPNLWGNAAEWFAAARACSFPTSSSPQVGAVATWGPGVDPPQGFGHCAAVISVAGDGSFTVSEMNWKGLGVVDTRTVRDRTDLQGFILPPGSSSGSDGSSSSSSGPDPFGIGQAAAGLTSAGQVAGGALIVLAGAALAVLLIVRPGPLRAL